MLEFFSTKTLTITKTTDIKNGCLFFETEIKNLN